MGLLAQLYQIASRADRALTKAKRLGPPVVSVGNISVGGRAKTPMVAEVCRRLRAMGRVPVVLTRGYGRASRAPVWIRPVGRHRLELWDPFTNSPLSLTTATELAALCGDEALEIAFREGVDVLVNSKRFENASAFLKITRREAPESLLRVVFVLDDGFQHWRLARDLDIVMIRAEDLSDKLLPEGRLRESPTALARAQLVFEIGRDVFKRSRLPETLVAGRDGASDPLLVLTTRAPDPDFLIELERLFGARPYRSLALGDHADRSTLLRAVNGFEGRLVLGWKEFVKFLGPEALALRGQAMPLATSVRIELLELDLEFADGGRRLDQALGRLR